MDYRETWKVSAFRFELIPRVNKLSEWFTPTNLQELLRRIKLLYLLFLKNITLCLPKYSFYGHYRTLSFNERVVTRIFNVALLFLLFHCVLFLHKLIYILRHKI